MGIRLIEKHQQNNGRGTGTITGAKVRVGNQWVDLESHGDGNLSAGNRQFRVQTKPTSATGNQEIVITPKKATVVNSNEIQEKPKYDYRSAFHSEDVIPFINTLTVGGFYNLSPTQWARRAYDTGNLLLGGMNWSNYTNSWINGNNGVVSDEFAKKHSTLSNTLNGAIDITTLSLPFNSTFSKLWNNGKIIQNKMPYNPNNFYREVGKNAIKDAKMSGVIRTGNKKRYMGPFFGKGSTPWQRENYIIEGTPEASNWIYANPYENYIQCMKDNPELCSGILESKPPILPVESTSNIGAEVFPYYNNQVAFQPLNEGFTYWKKHPIIGWRQHNFKQGGKMYKFKKGNKIHIKKANRGKFTDYCGGEVTNECIQRGKHSSNPAVRKRATFADNARHFKHKLGGQIIQEFKLKEC